MINSIIALWGNLLCCMKIHALPPKTKDAGVEQTLRRCKRCKNLVKTSRP